MSPTDNNSVGACGHVWAPYPSTVQYAENYHSQLGITELCLPLYMHKFKAQNAMPYLVA